MDPLFIIGTERSGSNLLRVILNSHPNIDVPHPPHLMRYFAELESGYGVPGSDAGFRALVEDMVRLIETHIYPWEIAVDVERVLRDATPRDAFGATAAIYDQHLRWSGKRRWGCKSTFMVRYTDRIFSTYPEARLLYLVRDPRDVAVSSRKSVFSPFHPWITARLWAEQQAIGLAALDRLPERQILLVRYEDLTAEPRPQIERICAFLGEDFHPGMLEFFKTEAASTGARLSESWQKTAQPIQRNSGKYRASLSPGEIRLVEAAAMEQMQHLGYEMDFDVQDLRVLRIGRREQASFRLQDLRLRAGVELRSMQKDENHWRRWRRDATARWFSMRRG